MVKQAVLILAVTAAITATVTAVQRVGPAKPIPAGQRLPAHPGQKGATFYALESQTTRLTTTFADATVIATISFASLIKSLSMASLTLPDSINSSEPVERFVRFFLHNSHLRDEVCLRLGAGGCPVICAD